MVSSTPAGFGLNDAVTRIVPGLVWVVAATMITNIGFNTHNLSSLSLTNIIFTSFLAYIIGEGNHLIRETIWPVPHTFRKVIFVETKDNSNLGVFYLRIKKLRSF